ncbi:ER membrane glycoprotein subunit of the GPI transamidase complex-like protein [Sporothrix curviconia]|uniref:GPI mannosyltransferase 2 n=1 Tax=Sporothrix curviconia TaxID=1260050 RepID=A0ABP0AVB5_9PEZI
MALSTWSAGHAGRLLLDHRQHPYRSLAAMFGIWKAFLLGIAALATLAGPAYDTSGDLLEAITANASANTLPGHAIPSGGIVSRFVSWDAIYYVQAARRGHIYEQEWAFGAALPAVVSFIQSTLASLGADVSVPVVAVAYAHFAHLLAVLLLYRLGCQVWIGAAGRTVAFVAACLHVLSPAGLFLSAPYAESSCALFSFAGYIAFAAGRKASSTGALSVKGDLLRLLAGVYFGVATLFRSNGLLNSMLFAYEAVAGSLMFLRQPSLALFRRLVFVGLGGMAVAAGTVVPQTVAYFQFCQAPSGMPRENFRPWCTALVPSIYSFVQEHYWGSGRLFGYWTLSNLPLFLLATPMLLVMADSSIDVWVLVANAAKDAKRKASGGGGGGGNGNVPSTQKEDGHGRVFDPRLGPLVQCMTAIQFLLATMAFTSYHVQIISRLSSAYPVWYWWLAQGLMGGPRSKLSGGIVVFMVMYASIQGILFASFLPPA